MWLDAAAAHARPPVGTSSIDPALLGWVGSRVRLDNVGPLAIDASAYGGASAESSGGKWLNAALGVESGRRVGTALLHGRAEVFGLDYREPFTYRAYGFSLRPEVARSLGSLTLTAGGQFVRGRWTMAGAAGGIPSAGVAPVLGTRSSGSLAVTGASLSVGRAVGPAWLEVSGRIQDARNGGTNGTFAGLGAEATFSIESVDVMLRLNRWDTPSGPETGLGATLSTELSERLVAYATTEKTTTDPLYGSPGSVTATAGLSLRIARRELARSMPIVEVAESADYGRRVRFRLPADDAERAAIAGDFTGWTPRAMKRSDGFWTIELVLEPGLHHFVFVLDGERWYVPDNAPGIVDDGWGRRNASLVVAEGK